MEARRSAAAEKLLVFLLVSAAAHPGYAWHVPRSSPVSTSDARVSLLVDPLDVSSWLDGDWDAGNAKPAGGEPNPRMPETRGRNLVEFRSSAPGNQAVQKAAAAFLAPARLSLSGALPVTDISATLNDRDIVIKGNNANIWFKDSGSRWESNTSYTSAALSAKIQCPMRPTWATVLSFALSAPVRRVQSATYIGFDFTLNNKWSVHASLVVKNVASRVPIKLGFDCGAGRHSYAVTWNKHFIGWYVDGVLVRSVFWGTSGQPFPPNGQTLQPMGMMSYGALMPWVKMPWGLGTKYSPPLQATWRSIQVLPNYDPPLTFNRTVCDATWGPVVTFPSTAFIPPPSSPPPPPVATPPSPSNASLAQPPQAVPPVAMPLAAPAQLLPPPTLESAYKIPIRDLILDTPLLYPVNGAGRGCLGCGRTASCGNVNIVINNKGGAEFKTPQGQSYGLFSADIMCPGGSNLSGIATAFYASSAYLSKGGGNQDEIDMEFLNRVNTVVQINTWVNGTSVYFKNVFLPFDCSEAYHNYAFLWTPRAIVWFVDYQPVAFFPNTDDGNFPHKPSKLIGSLWDASWICNGCWTGQRASETLVPNWHATARYRNVRVSAPWLMYPWG